MVHRAPDSRLLNNLITHEKEYTKHLSALFPISHTALASLSAFTAAYPAPSTPHATPSQTLAAVVDVLATADDALQRYNKAMEAWREQLVSLKKLEDDLGAILRDRDILVTRLIKASKSTKSSRDVRSSLLIPPGSASLSSLPSTISSSHGGTSSSKLAQAQAELQACEAHLTSKERELEARRMAVAREGLGARCRALIDCGWVWGEMGKQGLQALQALSGTAKNASKPLPVPSPYRSTEHTPSHRTNNPTSYASDNSSLTPSQSASQMAPRSAETSVEGPPSRGNHHDPSPERTYTQRIPARDEPGGEVTITLPPAHAISDLTFPTVVRSQSQRTSPTSQPEPGRKRSKRQRRPPSQHIAEVDEDEDDAQALVPMVTVTNPLITPAPRFPFSSAHANDGVSVHDSSSDEDPPRGPLEIIENDPFAQMKQRASPHSPSPTTNSQRFTATPSPQLSVSKPRERRTSMAFFGSIRGLFRHKPKERGSVEWEEGQGQYSPTRNKPKGGSNGWVTRTDARLKSKGRGDSSDDDAPTPRASGTPSGHATGSKLRKGRLGVQNGSSPGATPGVDGWMTDSATMANRRETIKRKKKKSVADLRGGDHGHSDNEVERRQGDTPGPLAQESTFQTQPQSQQSAKATSFDSLARRSSTSKSVTPVPTNYSPRRVTTDFSGGVGGTGSKETSSPPGSAYHSVSVSASASATVTPTPSHVHTDASTASKPKPKKDGSKHGVHYANGNVSQSLMSIVADVTRQNREGWATAGTAPDGSSAAVQLEIPKAPSLTTPVPTAEHQKTRSLDIPRAPASVATVTVLPEGRRSVDAGHGATQPQAKAHGHGHHRSVSTPAAHDIVSSPSSVNMNGTPANQTNGRALPKLPLRSALRNSSRTPSPSPARFADAGTQREVGKVQEAPVSDATPEPAERGRSPSLASISSYVTVRESFEDDVAEPEPDGVLGRPFTPPPRSSSLPPHRSSLPPPPRTSSPPSRTSSPPFSFPPPPVESPPPQKAPRYFSGQQEDVGSGSAAPSSTVSAETIPRRKSVRVSLPPTFSPSPPARYDDDDDATYESWSDVKPPSGRSGGSEGGWKMRNGGAGAGVWEDSSEEDADYARARKLLSRVGKKEKERDGGKGKGKGKGKV